MLNSEGKIDYNGNEVLINHLIDKGINGLLFLGSMGEFFAFTSEEKKAFTKFVIRTVNKRVPVLIGTGGTVLEEVVELSQFAEEEGADGLVVVSPYYFKLDEASLYRYYLTIAGSTNLPVLLYNFPDRTAVNLSPKLVLQLAEEYPNIVGIKDTMDCLSHTRELIQTVKSKIPDFSVLAGFDEYLLPNLLAGGDGVICGLTNVVPELFTELMEAFRKGELDSLKDLQQRIGTMMNVYQISQPFIAAIKAAVVLRGLPIEAHVKEPGKLLDQMQINQIKELFLKANIEWRSGVYES